jgi:hypothetical protein
VEREALKLALEALTIIDYIPCCTDQTCQKCKATPQPVQEPDMQTGIAYQKGFYDGKQAALAGREWNFCERCGKRTKDMTVIHTCTPPQ